jgi:soluble lytic murein transglycosylase-like protein
MLKLIDVFVWVCVVLLILTLVLAIAKADEPEVSMDLVEPTAEMSMAPESQEVNDYVAWFLQHYPKRRARALSYVPLVIHWCEYYYVDPLLVSIMISKESSWRPDVRGRSHGEYGLMQVHGRKSIRGFDMTTPAGQIQAGVKRLKFAIDKCSTLIQAINHYGTGYCKPVRKFAKRRMRIYKRAVKQFRRQL